MGCLAAGVRGRPETRREARRLRSERAAGETEMEGDLLRCIEVL